MASSLVAEAFQDHIAAVEATLADSEKIEEAAAIVRSALTSGRQVLLCGNGGSASDAEHIAGEIVGRFLKERDGLPAIALSANTTVNSAIANDYGFESVYERQVIAYGQPGDVLIALSTSGNSANVVRAVEAANGRGLQTIGMTARSGGKLKEICDLCICVPTDTTARAQEVHILVGHLICQIAEA